MLPDARAFIIYVYIFFTHAFEIHYFLNTYLMMWPLRVRGKMPFSIGKFIRGSHINKLSTNPFFLQQMIVALEGKTSGWKIKSKLNYQNTLNELCLPLSLPDGLSLAFYRNLKPKPWVICLAPKIEGLRELHAMCSLSRSLHLFP